VERGRSADGVDRASRRAGRDGAGQRIQPALAAAGATYADIVKLGVFVTDISILPVIREVRDRHVDRANPPASTAVEVSSLFRPGYVVEIEALAIVE